MVQRPLQASVDQHTAVRGPVPRIFRMGLRGAGRQSQLQGSSGARTGVPTRLIPGIAVPPCDAGNKDAPGAAAGLQKREERTERKEEAPGDARQEVPLGFLFCTPALTLHRPARGPTRDLLKSPELCPSAQGTSGLRKSSD